MLHFRNGAAILAHIMPRPNMLHRSITSWLSNDKSQPFWFCFAALCFLRHILLVCPSDLLQWCTSFSNLLLSTNGGRFNPCASLSSSTEVVKRVPKGKSFWISFDSHAASSQNTVRKFTGWPWLFQQIFEAKQKYYFELGAYFFENSYILHQHLFHSFALSTNDSEHRPVRHL